MPACYQKTTKPRAGNSVILQGQFTGDAKNAHLKKLENAEENLHIFKAELLDFNSTSTAIAGCEGVFHLASPVLVSKLQDPEVEVITPAIMGTLNVLKASSEAKIKRVVVVSSMGAVLMNTNWPKDTTADENCWSDLEFCRVTENWYCASKTMAECEALDFAERSGLNVVTICPSVVIGPSLQQESNYGSRFLLNHIKAGTEPMENALWHFVDVRDVAEALLLIFLKPEATGRYICTAESCSNRDLVEKLKCIYPQYCYPNFIKTDKGYKLSSQKLQRLGWRSRRLEDSLVDAVEYFREAGLLSKD